MILRVALCLLVLAGTLRAHDPGLSSAQITVGPREVAVQLLLAPGDVEALPDSSTEAIARGIELRGSAGDTLKPVSAIKSVKPPDAEIQLRYTLPTSGELFFRAPLIADLPFGHRQVLTVRDAAGVAQPSQLLGADHPSVQILLPGEPSGARPAAVVQTSLSGFFLLGIEHILTGYDHLLFLFALLLVCDSLVAAAKIITCFTLAHSLTLALATFDVVQMPSTVIEPLIAASIIYVGVENIVAGQKVRWRYALTFAFGLIHGLGFAGILRELGVGSSGAAVAGPLLTFNLGVELGQLAVAALVLPLLLWLRHKPLFLTRGVPAFSLAVAAAGAYWLIERTLLQN